MDLISPVALAIHPNWLTSRSFTFKAGDPGKILAADLRFELNSRISGYRHSNETGWQIKNDQLHILRGDGLPSCIASLKYSDDGTATLAGRYLFGAGRHLHCFVENRRKPGALPEIRTFDLFDTLVARRCGNPLAIFDAVERRSGVADFACLRRSVESGLFHSGDYGFDDIYAALGQETGWPAKTLQILQTMELAEEWDNFYPITEMTKRVGPLDAVVSDMYLPLSFVRRIVDEKCRLSGRTIHLSSHGKYNGTVWPKILANNAIARHHGDNQHSDVVIAARAGIAVEHVTVANWSRAEQILLQAGLPDFAKVVREARLRTYHENPLLRRAQLAQFEMNIPLLIVASLIVLSHAKRRNIDTLLMCSRDCNLWVLLMRWMAKITATPLRIRYFVSSRVLLLTGASAYNDYFMRERGKRTMLVDVSGTGRSSSYFLGQVGAQDDTEILLIAHTPRVANWVLDLAPGTEDVRVEYMTQQPLVRRLTIESLNMAMEDRPVRAVHAGSRVAFERIPNEFGPAAHSIITTMRAAFLTTIKLLKHSEIHQQFDSIPENDLRLAAEAIIENCLDFRDVTGIVGEDILQSECEIEAMARAERLPDPAWNHTQPFPPEAPMHGQSLEEQQKYETVWRHGDYRKHSPGLEVLTSSNVVDFFRRRGVMSILDAGCGAGQVMEWLVKNHPEFRVHGFDIAANCLNPFFAGRESEFLTTGCLWIQQDIPTRFDAVFCTDVLEHIPPEHVDAVLLNLCNASGKAAFLSIALFEDGFGPIIVGAHLHLTVRPAAWWIERIRAAGFGIEAQSVAQDQSGKPTWLHVAAVPLLN